MQQSQDGGGGQVMQKHTEITLTRVQNFKTRFLLKRLYPKGQERPPIALSVHEPEGTSRPPYSEVASLPPEAFKEARIGGLAASFRWFIPASLSLCLSSSKTPLALSGRPSGSVWSLPSQPSGETKRLLASPPPPKATQRDESPPARLWWSGAPEVGLQL